jgi:hypothetical protein
VAKGQRESFNLFKDFRQMFWSILLVAGAAQGRNPAQSAEPTG